MALPDNEYLRVIATNTAPLAGGGTVTIDATGLTITGVKLLDSGGGNYGSISAAGALKVDGSAVTQPVSIASMPSTAVTGTFYQATQPVSLASVPSHAVTNAGTFSVQVSSAPTTAVTGTFWQATQPVSGTVTTIPTANTRTLAGGAAATSNGSVSSGAFAATFIFSSDFTGTIASTSFNGASDRSFTTPPLPSGQTYSAIAYVVTTGSVRILTVT